MELILVVDIGTSSIKAGVVDEKGKILSSGERELEIERPEKGAAEHNPHTLYNIFLEISRQVLRGFEDKISVLTLSAYQDGLLPVDNKMEPLMGMMTLMDTRPQEIFEKLREKYNIDKLYQNTGCPPLFIYPLIKILWLREKKKKIFEKVRFFLGSKDYIIYRLLGEPFTEPSIASATQLFNIHSLQWDDMAFQIAEIDKNKLPPVVPGEKILTKLPPQARASLGLVNEVYLLPGVYDGGGIALGIGIGGKGDGLGVVNLGTTAMLRSASSKVILDKSGEMRFQTYYLCSGKWLPGAAINNAGIVLRWFRDNILSSDYTSLVSLAEEVKAGSDGLFFLPFLTGERDPRIGNFSSGVLFGLKEYHTRNHLLRAFLEGVAYALCLIKQSLLDNDIKINDIRMGGGGARSDCWTQIFADILGLPIRRISESEHASLIGEALLAYVALGKYCSLEEATEKMVKLSPPLNPLPRNMEIYQTGFTFFSLLLERMEDMYRQHHRLFV